VGCATAVISQAKPSRQSGECAGLEKESEKESAVSLRKGDAATAVGIREGCFYAGTRSSARKADTSGG